MRHVDSTRAAKERNPEPPYTQGMPRPKAGPAKPPKAGPLPFASPPHALVADARLKSLDVRLAAVLTRYARAKDHCWPSVDSLARDLRRCRRTVQYALGRLAGAGWVKSAPADNPTGRVVVLLWRVDAAENCTPGVQSSAPPPVPEVAPELAAPEKRSEKESGGRSAQVPPPAETEDAKRARLASWLDRPAGDLLRRLAEKALAAPLPFPGAAVDVAAGRGAAVPWRPVPGRRWRPSPGDSPPAH